MRLSRNLNFPNRWMRTRTSGGVGGVWQGDSCHPYPDNDERFIGAPSRDGHEEPPMN
jgi:hypothetical protein